MAGFYMSELRGAQRQSVIRATKIALWRKSDCNFTPDVCTTAASMEMPSSASGLATPKNLVGLSVIFLLAAAVFGIMNGQKVSALKAARINAEAGRDAAEKKRFDEQKEIKAREAAAAQAQTKAAEAETVANKIQSDLAQLQAEKADLQTKLQAAQAEVASIQHQTDATGGGKAPDGANPGAASPNELQAQLDEARKQLENAEHENAFLSEKIRATQDRADQINQERKRRQTAVGRAGIRGTILAVNQAYNFVVLNLGGRQGVEPNAEMLVMRDGTLIGKIRISSVEPSSAIGDVVTSSLERGVQVQPGDIVVYAGSNS